MTTTEVQPLQRTAPSATERNPRVEGTPGTAAVKLAPLQRKTPGGSGPSMDPWRRRVIGMWLLTAGSLSLGHALWAWSLAARLLSPAPAGTPSVANPALQVSAHWFGIGFHASAPFALLLVVVATALAGSTATTCLVFANRAGHRTLEQHWEWWYVVRPVAAAAVGLLLWAVVGAGLLGASVNGGGQLSLAGAVGGLAGLFTDRALATLRSALGASAFTVSASDPDQAAHTGGVTAAERARHASAQTTSNSSRTTNLDVS